MDPVEALYDEHDRERIVAEPPKRVQAPERLAFERDRARVVHAASFRRLAAKTQVVGPQSDDFVRNRLTHSLEVAQIARDLARALGTHADIVETAALAHDLGHPPFGHNGERALAELAEGIGGFEGNAQTLRLLARLEAKTADAAGESVGLNLTRATLDACTKYPWGQQDAPADNPAKFGVYDDDRAAFAWLRRGAPATRRCLEAQVMDLADDVADSVHDVEDAVVAGKIDLARLDADLPAIRATVRAWYLPAIEDAELDAVLARLRAVDGWPSAPYDGGRRALAALKNLTSDLIGRFCGAVQEATFAAAEGPFVRYRADLVVPAATLQEIALLKGLAVHFVMQDATRLAQQERQRELLTELVETLAAGGQELLDAASAADWHRAGDDAGRLRVVIDQVASLTDASAVAWHQRLCR
ncbi:deoxyguanosinetriphosphate triphosphohydrolase [Nocardioides sp.]|uniref:deoxyguanosinetriphosphate triphosphohydrolase n=1 Tax=Nocardioides sp. TaxID=35761 RepID=UPI003519B8CC